MVIQFELLSSSLSFICLCVLNPKLEVKYFTNLFIVCSNKFSTKTRYLMFKLIHFFVFWQKSKNSEFDACNMFQKGLTGQENTEKEVKYSNSCTFLQVHRLIGKR